LGFHTISEELLNLSQLLLVRLESLSLRIHLLLFLLVKFLSVVLALAGWFILLVELLLFIVLLEVLLVAFVLLLLVLRFGFIFELLFIFLFILMIGRFLPFGLLLLG
jgi:hypothetical protein